jgi:hypothetical protein
MAYPKAKNIPVKRGTVVMLRDSNGRLTGKRAIVLRNQTANNFSRAYGRQVDVCVVSRLRINKGPNTHLPMIVGKGAGDLYPVGKVKKIPKVCRQALAEHDADERANNPRKKR